MVCKAADLAYSRLAACYDIAASLAHRQSSAPACKVGTSQHMAASINELAQGRRSAATVVKAGLRLRKDDSQVLRPNGKPATAVQPSQEMRRLLCVRQNL